MISKVEAILKLKKMGMNVTDDHSIVTILVPAGMSFEKGVKEVRARLKEIGYVSSFCIKQSKEAVLENNSHSPELQEEAFDENTAKDEEGWEGSTTDEEIPIEEISDEEAGNYLLSDMVDEFPMDEDGQFTLESFGIGL